MPSMPAYLYSGLLRIKTHDSIKPPIEASSLNTGRVETEPVIYDSSKQI